MISSPRENLRGTHAVVTGGASGIGLRITRMLLAEGANVTVMDINNIRVAAVLGDVTAAHSASKVTLQICNVADYASVLQAFESAYSQFGKIDIVVANAGISAENKPGHNFLENPTSLSVNTLPPLTVLDVNLTGVMYTVYAGLYYIRKSGQGGSILCTSSTAGIYPFPMAPVYATAKHGVVGLVRSMGPVLIKEGITMNGLAPSIIKTNLDPDLASDPLFSRMIETPHEVLASAVKELLSNRSLTGQIAEMGPEGEHGCLFREPPAYINDSTRDNMQIFMDLMG